MPVEGLVEGDADIVTGCFSQIYLFPHSLGAVWSPGGRGIRSKGEEGFTFLVEL